MTTLFGSAQADISEQRAKAPRFYLMAGGEFLFWDGSKVTKKRAQAWSGSIEQARNARLRFPTAAGLKAIPIHSITPTLQPEEAE